MSSYIGNMSRLIHNLDLFKSYGEVMVVLVFLLVMFEYTNNSLWWILKSLQIWMVAEVWSERIPSIFSATLSNIAVPLDNRHWKQKTYNVFSCLYSVISENKTKLKVKLRKDNNCFSFSSVINEKNYSN